jgi:hypothetical protein
MKRDEITGGFLYNKSEVCQLVDRSREWLYQKIREGKVEDKKYYTDNDITFISRLKDWRYSTGRRKGLSRQGWYL